MDNIETQRTSRPARIPPDLETGLTAEQVQARRAEGFVNTDDTIKTKTEKQIILENTFTFFKYYWETVICMKNTNFSFFDLIIHVHCNIFLRLLLKWLFQYLYW